MFSKSSVWSFVWCLRQVLMLLDLCLICFYFVFDFWLVVWPSPFAVGLVIFLFLFWLFFLWLVFWPKTVKKSHRFVCREKSHPPTLTPTLLYPTTLTTTPTLIFFFLFHHVSPLWAVLSPIQLRTLLSSYSDSVTPSPTLTTTPMLLLL